MDIILIGLLLTVVGFVMIFFTSDEWIEYSMGKAIEKHFDEFYN